MPCERLNDLTARRYEGLRLHVLVVTTAVSCAITHEITISLQPAKYYFQLLFNRLIFHRYTPDLDRVLHTSSREPLWIADARFVQTACPFRHSTNSVKALKRSTVCKVHFITRKINS